MNDQTIDRKDLVRAIAAYVPDFEYCEPDNGRSPYLAGPGGMEIHIGNARDRGKLHIHGAWPMNGTAYMSPRSWGAIAYGEAENSDINVSTARGPEIVAREIVRRFLPQYRALHSRCIERKREKENYNSRALDSARRIAQAAGVATPQSKGTETEFRFSVGFYGDDKWYGNATVYDQHANLELRSVPVEIAARIIEMLKANATRLPEA